MRPVVELLGPELAEQLVTSPPPRQRDMAVAAAICAVLAAGLIDPVIDEALGDVVESNFNAGMRSAVEAIEAHLDDRAWALQEAVDAGTGSADKYLAAFRRARAVSAVKYSFEQNTVEAVNETVYEAFHAAGGDVRLRQLVEAIVDFVAPGNVWAARDLARLFWPRFVVVDGYVLLASQYTPDNFAAFRKDRPNSPAAVEDVMNHVHLEDLYPGPKKDELFYRTAHNLAAAWRTTLADQFPSRVMRVELDDSVDKTLTAFRVE